ncbi:hypothetical protein L1987_05387 [Smallanthus sonchifolius]|uniref:Uncharacterized protein n=1 Tax=Smallanthus sonchifolius TaxID=185202 RepID=A0ACB9JV83_9ASTR|nr:hypothetical protein L1987_05387 [Smallanthus sonchifolius]
MRPLHFKIKATLQIVTFVWSASSATNIYSFFIYLLQMLNQLNVDVPLIRPRTLLPAMEIKEGNKRPAVMCKLFAKGWCSRGTSCRFCHINDTTNVGDKENKTQKSDEGVHEGTRSNPAVSAATVITCSSEIQPTSQKENPATNFSYLDTDNDNPPVNAVNLLHGRLSNPFIGLPNIQGRNWVSYATEMQEIGGKGYHSHDYNSSYHSLICPRTSTLLSSSLKSDSKFSSYDWEPSKPFRSAFLISQGISTPEIQYDPIRESIEPPPKLSKLSSCSRVPSISGTDLPSKGKLKTEYGSDKFSVGSHIKRNDNGMDVDSNEVADTKQEITKSESKGNKHIGDVIQASEARVSSHSSLRQDDGGTTKEVNKQKLVFDAEGDTHRESKSLRHFRAALIELVKPTWRDGKLSKDAHKLIVKKAVEKVLITLAPGQIPSIQESIDMYLTSSQPKLKKLVEVRMYWKVWKTVTYFLLNGQESSLSDSLGVVEYSSMEPEEEEQGNLDSICLLFGKSMPLRLMPDNTLDTYALTIVTMEELIRMEKGLMQYDTVVHHCYKSST